MIDWQLFLVCAGILVAVIGVQAFGVWFQVWLQRRERLADYRLERESKAEMKRLREAYLAKAKADHGRLSVLNPGGPVSPGQPTSVESADFPLLKVKLMGAWQPLTIETLEDYLAPDHPLVKAAEGHRDHRLIGYYTLVGYRRMKCQTCDVQIWTHADAETWTTGGGE